MYSYAISLKRATAAACLLSLTVLSSKYQKNCSIIDAELQQ
jgi:hypothetical protein